VNPPDDLHRNRYIRSARRIGRDARQFDEVFTAVPYHGTGLTVRNSSPILCNKCFSLMSDTPFVPLTSDADWAEARDRSAKTPVLIFKHSSSCPVSGQADAEMTELARETDVPIYRVVVQNHRAVSNIIETELGVRHETPQTILLHEQSPVFNTSHFNVTADTLREELRRVSVSIQ